MKEYSYQLLIKATIYDRYIHVIIFFIECNLFFCISFSVNILQG